MNLRKIHKVVGVVLVIPLLGWALTGIVFLTKPGYEGAYEQLAIKTYPLEQTFSLTPVVNWHEARLLRTVLGYHLLLAENGRTVHLDPRSFEARRLPSDADIKRLVYDAIGANSKRYGELVAVDGGKVTTSTGVEITLDWTNLSLAQAGRDTRLIDGLYKIHYLQWLGRPFPDALLGATGIVLLLLLTGLGLAVFILSRRQ
jgi:PepSY-associated TM region